jgi:hypothetical protein
MKKLLFITTVAVLLTLFSCKRETNTMTVVKDCTGTYLRIHGKDFKVCNLGKLSSVPAGATVTATLKKIDNCKSLDDRFFCMMFHENEGWVEIVKLK